MEKKVLICYNKIKYNVCPTFFVMKTFNREKNSYKLKVLYILIDNILKKL